MKIKERLIWKDKKTNELVFIFIILVSLIIGFLFFIIIEDNLKKIIFSIIFIILSLNALYAQLVRKLCIIYRSGILMGNITLSKWHKIGLRKRFFLKWKEIETVYLEGHEVKVTLASIEKMFVYIKVKNYKKKYECVIYDPEGFVKALKTLGKQKLLSKESRYR